MLTVVMTSMPAASSSSMSCQRLSLREPGHVRVRELVDQRDLRSASQDGVDVHLGERGAPVGERPPRDDLETVDHLGGVPAAVGLDEPDHDVGPALGAAVALAEHGVGLADAGCCAEVDPESSAGAHGSVCRPRPASSRARLSSSTLTRVRRGTRAPRPSV